MNQTEHQKLWDRQLLNAYFRNWSCGKTVGKFMEDHPDIDVGTLLRVPPRVLAKMSVVTFVAMFLPKLAKVLAVTVWDDVERRAAILVKLSKSRMDAEKERFKTAGDKELQAVQASSRRSYSTAVRNQKLSDLHWDSHKASNQWGVCK